MKRVLKVVVALALIAVLVSRMEWADIVPRLQHLSLWSLLGALAIMLWELIISTQRWSIALRMHGLAFSFSYLFRALANGYFFNNFLPSAIGGDAYRVYRTLPPDGYRSRALSAVFIDRLSGFAMLLTLGALAAVYLYRVQPMARAYLWTFCVGAAAAIAIVGALLRGWLKVLTDRIRHTALYDALHHNSQRLLSARADWPQLIASAVVFQATSVLLVYWLFTIVGHPQPIAYCALMTAASGIAALLPVSINGIGLMEGSLVGMAVALGVDYDVAALVAIVRRLLMFSLSLLCGLSYMFERKTAAVAPQG